MAGFIDCIVVGGGVVGLSVARRLATDGVSVTLLEKGVCGAEASWAGAGFLTPCNPHRKNATYQLQQRSIEMYPAFCEELLAETDVDTEYEPCGKFGLLDSKSTLGQARSEVRVLENSAMSSGAAPLEILSIDEARQLEPAISDKFLAVRFCRQSAQVRNPRLLRALYKSCIARGVDIREHCAVDDFLVEKNRVAGVVIKSESIRANWVILCGGAWSTTIGSMLHQLMPVHPVRGQIVLMKLDGRPFKSIISRGKVYLVPRRDGHVILGATEEHQSGFTKRNTAEGIAWLTKEALVMVPSLKSAAIVKTWSGLRPGTPDDKPYIGPVPGLAGLIAATGHFRAGLTQAPATAEAVATMVNGESFDIDLDDFRPGRPLKQRAL